MPKLSHDESLALLRLIVRGQNTLKGEALDLGRLALPQTKSDRQFKEFSTRMKSTESAIRAHLAKALVEAGVTEDINNETLFSMK